MPAASTRHITVVGAVIEVGGEVLCARRSTGPLTGLWEFPGGKVEPDESPQAALAREIDEELGCRISVGDEVTTTSYAYDFGVVTLTTYRCELVAGVPQPNDHDEFRWLPPGRLQELDWAPADVPAVDLLRR